MRLLNTTIIVFFALLTLALGFSYYAYWQKGKQEPVFFHVFCYDNEAPVVVNGIPALGFNHIADVINIWNGEVHLERYAGSTRDMPVGHGDQKIYNMNAIYMHGHVFSVWWIPTPFAAVFAALVFARRMQKTSSKRGFFVQLK